MNFRNLSRFLLILPLLVSVLSLTPAQAAGPAQVTNDAKVMWCPAAVTTPTPSKYGCTAAFRRLVDLWDTLRTTNPAKAGTIWLGRNYNTANAGDEDQLWDGSVLTNMANYPITLNGGWKGPGTSALDPNSPSVFDGHSLAILSWHHSVTLRNIQVKNADSTYYPIYPASVCVVTDGSVKLDRVQVLGMSGSHFYGAMLGSFVSVTVTNSLFLRNDGEGLLVDASGPVILKNVVSSQNMNIGIDIDNNRGTGGFPVTITNGLFDANQGNGLYVRSNGTVTLTDVEAKDNTSDGIYVDTHNGIGDVLLKGTNTVMGNGDDGLEVITDGKISAEHLVTYENYTSGAQLDAGTAVTINRGEIKSNRLYGLKIDADGLISARNLTVTNNGTGLDLNSGVSADTQAVTLSAVKVAFGAGNGIDISTDGKVTLSCGATYGNGSEGLFLSDYDHTSGPAGALKLQGFRSYLNGRDEYFYPDQIVTRTACP